MVATKQKVKKLGALFAGLLALSGIILLYTGHDAIAMGNEKKAGIVTAEQVKVSFDSVSGRLIKEAVKEGQTVKKGDVLMALDSTDVDLEIAKTKTQINQLQAQIDSLNGSIGVGNARTDTSEIQSRHQIDQQRAAVEAAEATYENKKLDYQRKAALAAQGAVAQVDLDNATSALQVAQANVTQQKQALNSLLGGATDTGDSATVNLPSIAESRQEWANKAHDVKSLEEQKKGLEVSLQALEVKKSRLTLRASEDGKVIKILAKEGEMISPNTPVILLQSNRAYYDIYVSELQARHLAEGDTLTGTEVANKQKVTGTIRLVTKAGSFADLKQSRENGQADLSSFLVRVYVNPDVAVRPGVTVEVNSNAFTEK